MDMACLSFCILGQKMPALPGEGSFALPNGTHQRVLEKKNNVFQDPFFNSHVTWYTSTSLVDFPCYLVGGSPLGFLSASPIKVSLARNPSLFP